LSSSRDPVRDRGIELRTKELYRATPPRLESNARDTEFVEWVSAFLNHMRQITHFHVNYLLLPVPKSTVDLKNSELIALIYSVVWGKLALAL